MTTNDLGQKMLRALYPRERLTPSQWAARYRKLSTEETSEPGSWSNGRTPYLTAIMDAAGDPVIEEILFLKGAQVGWSEACRNVLGFWIDADPGPCLLVAPSQKAVEDQVDERIKPLTMHTPAVKRHLRDGVSDNKKHRIRFDSMSLYFGWAGSSQSVKSRPIRYLILEEPDEFPSESGAGGDPISKAEK